MLELASVVAAPGGFRKVDEGVLESPDSGDELELSRAAGSARRRRLFHAVGESLEFRKGLGDRAGDLGSLGLLERREQLGDPDPDGGEEAFPLTGRNVGAASSGSSQSCARPLGASLRTGRARCFRSW